MLARLHKAIFALAIAGSVISLIIGLGEGLATTHAPTIPNPAKGLVVPVNVHGTIGYITRTNDLWLNWAWRVYVPCFLYAWVSIAYPKWRKWRDAGGTRV